MVKKRKQSKMATKKDQTKEVGTAKGSIDCVNALTLT